MLRRDAEGVPAHRVEDIVPGHPLEAREHVAHRIVADMPHMDAPRGIGEHLEDIGLGPSTVLGVAGLGRGEAVRGLPCRLPAGIGSQGAKARFAGHSCLTPLSVWSEIGRASCRERVCQYVSLSVVAVLL